MKCCGKWDMQTKYKQWACLIGIQVLYRRQQVEKNRSQHLQGCRVWLKPMPQEVGGRSSPRGGEQSEKAPEIGHLRRLGGVGGAWELGRAALVFGEEHHIRGNLEIGLGANGFFRLKDSCSFFKCLFKFNSVPSSLPSITGCGWQH